MGYRKGVDTFVGVGQVLGERGGVHKVERSTVRDVEDLHAPGEVGGYTFIADAVRRRIEKTARARLVRAGVARTVVVAFFVVVVAPALLDLARVRGGSE